MPYDPNQLQPPKPKYPQPGDPGSRTETWKTLEPPQRDWSKPGIQWAPPSYSTSSMTYGPPMPAAAPSPAGAAPVTGASMAPNFSDRGDINDMLGQSPETSFLQPNPTPSPTPTPTPAGLTSPLAKLGLDYYRSLYGRM